MSSEVRCATEGRSSSLRCQVSGIERHAPDFALRYRRSEGEKRRTAASPPGVDVELRSSLGGIHRCLGRNLGPFLCHNFRQSPCHPAVGSPGGSGGSQLLPRIQSHPPDRSGPDPQSWSSGDVVPNSPACERAHTFAACAEACEKRLNGVRPRCVRRSTGAPGTRAHSTLDG